MNSKQIILTILTLTFFSCKKDYQCNCVTANGATGTVSFKEKTRSRAENYCKVIENSPNVRTPDSTPYTECHLN